MKQFQLILTPINKATLVRTYQTITVSGLPFSFLKKSLSTFNDKKSFVHTDTVAHLSIRYTLITMKTHQSLSAFNLPTRASLPLLVSVSPMTGSLAFLLQKSSVILEEYGELLRCIFTCILFSCWIEPPTMLYFHFHSRMVF